MATEGKIQMWRRHLENRDLGRAQLYTLKILKYLWIDCLLTSVKKLIPQQARYLVSSCLTDFFFSIYVNFCNCSETASSDKLKLFSKNMFLMFWVGLYPKYWWRLIHILFSFVPLFLCKCHWSRFCVVI